MNLSSRHHYLPQFYLKGFTDSDGMFYVFDIEHRRVKSKKLYPKQVFFEKDRNTFILGGEKTDFLESSIYQFIDNKNSKNFKRITESTRETKLEAIDYISLHYFIASLFWRIPRTDSEINIIFENSSYKDLHFHIINKTTGEISIDKSNEMMKTPEFRKSYRATMAALDLAKWNPEINRNNWQIGYALNSDTPNICGDNPIVFRDNNNLNLFKGELIFPLTKNKTLFYTNRGIRLKEISPEFRMKLDLVIMMQSKLMITSTNGDYLKTLSALKSQFDIAKLKESLFQIFD